MVPPAESHGRRALPHLVLAVILLSACRLASAVASEGASKTRTLEPLPESSLSSGSIDVVRPETGHARMLRLLKEIAATAGDVRRFTKGVDPDRLRNAVKRLEPESPPLEKLTAYFELGNVELMLGHELSAIENLRAAYALIPEAATELPSAFQNRVTFRLGVAYMRRDETLKCNTGRVKDCCIVPMIHVKGHGRTPESRAAIELFTEVLANVPDDSLAQFAIRWLLNVAYMHEGRYPDDVPDEYLIPPGVFRAKEGFPRYENVAARLGVDIPSRAGGVVADDLDGDGDVDLLLSEWAKAAPLRYFENVEGGEFRERTNAAGLRGLTGGLNMVQGDYDNDGDVDVLVLRGAWLGKAGRHPNSLLRNNGDGTFTDVTFETGLGEVHYPTQTASWADYDNDGALDIYIGNESREIRAPGQLFRNSGDGTFVDVAADAGVENFRFAKAVVWGDYDSDRDPDLFISNLRGRNRLYRNNGDGTFTDVSRRLHVSEPAASFPAWFWDFDNDGVLDLFVSGYAANIGPVTASYLGYTVEPGQAALYRGDGRGGFVDVAANVGLTRLSAPMGANFGDLDNDGYLDFYLGTGYPDPQEMMPNVMYRNRGGREFIDVSAAGGFASLHKGHAIAFADFDADGEREVFERMGGALDNDTSRDVLYRSPGFGNHWVGLTLVGTQTNRSAIGARIHVVTIEKGRRRDIYKYVSSGGSFGANPLRQIVGLGKPESIECLEIYWPTSDLRQVFRDIPMDTWMVVIENRTDTPILAS